MNNTCVKVKEIWATLRFDTSGWDSEKLNKLFRAETLLREIGFTTDTGVGCGGRDWELDWSMHGAKLINPRKVRPYTPPNKQSPQADSGEPAYLTIMNNYQRKTKWSSKNPFLKFWDVVTGRYQSITWEDVQEEILRQLKEQH